MKLKKHSGIWGYDKETIATEDSSSGKKVTKTIEPQPGKTLWDWLQLLIIPAVLAVVGALFSYQQNQASLMSERQHQTDLQIAQDQQQETLLQGYLDHMSDLLLNGHLRESKPGAVVRDVARVRTLETLFRLDPGRREAVLGFLFEAGLIGVSIERGGVGQKLYSPIPTIVYLNGADLIKTDLIGHILSEADLSRAALLTTNLHGAILEDTNLAGAELNSADLSDAALEGAKMNNVKDLRGTILQGAQYNVRTKQVKNAQGNPLTLEPTQWPQGFDPIAAGAICIDCSIHP
jgi:hypothetical protein